MRKVNIVARINNILEMDHQLSVWQFLSVRKYELEEMLTKVEALYEQAHGKPYNPEAYHPMHSPASQSREFRYRT